MYNFDKPKHKLNTNIIFIISHCASNGFKICWGTKIFDLLDEDKKKENMTLDDALLILANI